MRVVLIILLALAVAGLVAMMWFNNEVIRRTEAPLSITEPEVIDIAAGNTLADVLETMTTRGYTQDAWWIRRNAIDSGFDKKLKVGEFRVLPGDSARSLFERIVAGEVIRYRFTIIEGWTLEQAVSSLGAAQLRHTPGLSAANLHEILKDSQTLSGPYLNMEGWLLPATYDYARSDLDIDLLRRAHVAMRVELERLWKTRSKDLPYADPYAALIMASIIEKESSIDADRPQIAAVFVRRLRIGMPLQTDPTVIYGIGPTFDGNLTKVHLKTPTPYNTYVNTGLPPTPISLPGIESLRAAMQPAAGENLYFVGRGDGTSQFSRTLAEHNKAVNQYQRSPKRSEASVQW